MPIKFTLVKSMSNLAVIDYYYKMRHHVAGPKDMIISNKTRLV